MNEHMCVCMHVEHCGHLACWLGATFFKKVLREFCLQLLFQKEVTPDLFKKVTSGKIPSDVLKKCHFGSDRGKTLQAEIP